jgi:hypothetical protein
MKHFPLVLSDEFIEITFEEFSDWVSKSDEVHSFLMEFFDMQTRYNAMKSFIKYLSEFELVFDVHKQENNDQVKMKTFTRKSNLLFKASNMLFSKDDVTIEPELNIVRNLFYNI